MFTVLEWVGLGMTLVSIVWGAWQKIAAMKANGAKLETEKVMAVVFDGVDDLKDVLKAKVSKKAAKLPGKVIETKARENGVKTKLDELLDKVGANR
jgi:hypothetical protein